MFTTFKYIGYVSGVQATSTMCFTIKFKKLVRYIDITTDQTSLNNFRNTDTCLPKHQPTNQPTNKQTNNQANKKTNKQTKNKQAS